MSNIRGKKCDKCGDHVQSASAVCELKAIRGFSDFCVFGVMASNTPSEKPAAKKPFKKKQYKKANS